MKSKQPQGDWRGLPVYDAIGRKFHLTTREMRHSAPSPWMLIWDLLAVAILVLSNVHDYRELLGIPLAAFLWLIMIFTITGFYLLILYLCINLSKRFTGFFIYFPVVGLIAMTITSFLNNFNYALMSGEAYTFELASSHLLFNLLLGFLFETMFMFFVYPVVLQGFDVGDDFEDITSPNRRIVVAGKTFTVDEINYVSAQDHYLEVNTQASSELLRGRLADVVGQLSGVDGMMPHRSYWVARKVVEGIGGKSGAKVLKLTDGTHIPIARSKVANVQKWLEQK